MLDYDEEFKSLGASKEFVQTWPQYANAMRKFCNTKFECEKHTEWSDDIENFLLMMKALPLTQKKGGRKEPFKNMIQKVIIFKVVRCGFQSDFIVLRLNSIDSLLKQQHLFSFILRSERIPTIWFVHRIVPHI